MYASCDNEGMLEYDNAVFQQQCTAAQRRADREYDEESQDESDTNTDNDDKESQDESDTNSDDDDSEESIDTTMALVAKVAAVISISRDGAKD